MNLIPKFVYNWMRKTVAQQDESQYVEMPKFKLPSAINQVNIASIGKEYTMDSLPESIRFELNSAIGGRILTVRRYDPKADRHEQLTYVIPTGEDLGQRVAKIINLEIIK